MKNHWLYVRGKRQTIREINFILSTFIGKSINPIDKLFLDMRADVITYFRNHPDKLKFFTDGFLPFDYTFEIEERQGKVSFVEFVIEP
jgi:hypothetical protein